MKTSWDPSKSFQSSAISSVSSVSIGGIVFAFGGDLHIWKRRSFSQFVLGAVAEASGRAGLRIRSGMGLDNTAH